MSAGPPFLVLSCLKNEGIESGEGVHVLLSVVAQREEGEVAVVVPEAFGHGGRHHARHAAKWHDVDNAADPVVQILQAFAQGKDGLARDIAGQVWIAPPQEGLGGLVVPAQEDILKEGNEGPFVPLLD